MSYVRSDDDHDNGKITQFRLRLEGEVKIQTGRPFEIFQDRNDIAWGQHWQERIVESISDATFLVPIITPSFFQSPACRDEFQRFILKEATLGVNRLILPLYYVACEELDPSFLKGQDQIVDVLRSRNWTDWRPFRFKPFNDEEVATALAKLASTIKGSMKELEAISETAEKKIASSSQSKTSKSGEIKNDPRSQMGLELSAPKMLSGNDFYFVPEVVKADDGKVQSGGYAAYTRQFDEVVDAAALAEPSEILALYKYVSRLANSLKKIYQPELTSLLARRDSSVVSSMAVTILIDNSGSMRGGKITHTAAWCLIILEWLDRLGISSEVLGYTTRAWKGGQSRQLWLSEGKPQNPGRLNDLRHLIYKSFSASVETSLTNFGVMAREGLLKENIDGEALLWAAARLRVQKAERKILFVFSDGAPVDDSTLSVNKGNLLDQHVRAVIKDLSAETKIYGLGIEHDVSDYYRTSRTVKDVSRLGIDFFELLAGDPDFKST